MVGVLLVLLLLLVALVMVMVRVVEPSGLVMSALVSWVLTSRSGVGRACGLVCLLLKTAQQIRIVMELHG